MFNSFSALAMIAENRIREAVENGELDNLPGQGKALHFEDVSHIPEELRMAYKILKNANCLPPEVACRKEAGQLADLLDALPDEQEKLRCMRKLRYLLEKASLGKRDLRLAADDEYYSKILSRLETHERKIKGGKPI